MTISKTEPADHSENAKLDSKNQSTHTELTKEQKTISILHEKALHQGFFRFSQLTLSHSQYSGDLSETMQRELFERGDAVVVLLYDTKAKSVVLVEQFRAGAAKKALQKNNPKAAWLLEPVAGMIDKDENPKEAAIREAKEETGSEISHLEFISRYYPSPGACDEELLLFAAEVDVKSASQYAGNRHEHEDIRVVVMPFDEAKTKLLNAEFSVASTFMALQWLFFQKIPSLKNY